MVKAGYCKDCKWWRKHEDHMDGECFLFDDYLDYQFNKAWLLGRSPKPFSNTPIHTKPDFGCVRFEEKETE